MLETPVPADEAERLRTLLALDLLDTAPEERFDRITRLAARLFDMPMAAFTLVDSTRLWFKSRIGLADAALPRAGSFCGQAILQDGVLVLGEPAADPRFAGNPLLGGAQPVRFYAGAPVRAPDGSKAGVLCLFDTRPRRLDAAARGQLADLAALAAGELEARALRQALQGQHEHAQRARATDDRRRKYFTTATHELRTPMASVLGFSELLLKRDFTASGAREVVGIIHSQAQRLVNLINEMLDLARIESGGAAALAIGPCPAAPLLERLLAGLQGLGDRARIRLAVAPGLPPVLADAAKLEQALLNVIGNAIKYAPDGSPIEVSAEAAALAGKPGVAFRIRDRGIGMTPEQQAQVFEPFYRAAPRGETVGSGLGMAIVQEIIQLHHGSVHLSSAPGAGTEVTLLLPAARPA